MSPRRSRRRTTPRWGCPACVDARQEQGDGVGAQNEHRHCGHQQCPRFQFPAPMEGWNDSGLGSRSGGADGIRKYCRTKSIVAWRVTMKKEPLWYPYSRKKGKIIAAMLRMASAKDWRRRLG